MPARIFILGAGRFGTHLATRLSSLGCEVIIGDSNPARVTALADDGFTALELDATDEDALREAGVLDADSNVVAIGNRMDASILACLALKKLNVPRLVGRAIDERHAQVLERLGVELVVLPTRDMAYALAERLRDNTTSDRRPLGDDFQIARIRLNARLHGRTLAEARLSDLFKVNVVLISRPNREGGSKSLEPEPAATILRGDSLLVVGRRDRINTFEREHGL